MSLKHIKLVSLILTLVPLVCLILYANTSSPTYVYMALVSVGGQFILRRSFWKCPYCGNALGHTDGSVCPHCGQKLNA